MEIKRKYNSEEYLTALKRAKTGEKEPAPLATRGSQEYFLHGITGGLIGNCLGYGLKAVIENNVSTQQEYLRYRNMDLLTAKLDAANFPLSSDALLSMATINSLCESVTKINNRYGGDHFIWSEFVKDFNRSHAIHCYEELHKKESNTGRSFGIQISNAVTKMKGDKEDPSKWIASYNNQAGGSGSAVMAVPIGLLFCEPQMTSCMIATAVTSSLFSHCNITGILGSVCVAAFTQYAALGLDPKTWINTLLQTAVPEAVDFIAENHPEIFNSIQNADGEDFEGLDREQKKEAIKSESYFVRCWQKLNINLRIDVTPKTCTPDKLYDYLSEFAWDKTTVKSRGCGGHDIAMYGLVALLWCEKNYETFLRAVTSHKGKTDSTGNVALPWFLLINGDRDVPENHYDTIEMKDRVTKCAENMTDAYNFLLAKYVTPKI